MAEESGSRTHRDRLTSPNGFEDRARHRPRFPSKNDINRLRGVIANGIWHGYGELSAQTLLAPVNCFKVCGDEVTGFCVNLVLITLCGERMLSQDGAAGA